jgi:hypothetical protein
MESRASLCGAEAAQRSMTTLGDRLVKFGVRIVRHGRWCCDNCLLTSPAACPIASAACASMIGTETRIWLPTTAEVCRVVATEAVTSACEAARWHHGVGHMPRTRPKPCESLERSGQTHPRKAAQTENPGFDALSI